MTIGNRIQNARKKKGYTQKQLAEICGVATGTIQQYELGKRQPRIEQLDKIASALDIPITELISSDVMDITNSMIELFANSNTLQSLEASEPESTQEHYLVSKFKTLNETGQEKAVEHVELLTKIPEYQKEPLKSEPLLNAAHAIPDASEENIQNDEDIMDDEDF